MGSAASFLYPNAPVVFRERWGRAEGRAGSEREEERGRERVREREREIPPLEKTKLSQASLGAIVGSVCAYVLPAQFD